MTDAPDRLPTRPLVLIVDDEEDMRALLRLTLELSGYRVLAAEDGERALSLLERHGGEVAVIVTDMIMPGIHGTAAIRGMRDRCPAAPVIASSGLPALGDDEMAELGVVSFLSKPFGLDALLRACEAAISPDS